MERTFVMVKPDGVRRGLTPEIIRRIEAAGFSIVAHRSVRMTFDQIDQTYPYDEAGVRSMGEKSLAMLAYLGLDPTEEYGSTDPMVVGTIVRQELTEFMASGPVDQFVLEGEGVIAGMRKLRGGTLPWESDIGTIRRDLSLKDPLAHRRYALNVVHAAENCEEAASQIAFWFGA